MSCKCNKSSFLLYVWEFESNFPRRFAGLIFQRFTAVSSFPVLFPLRYPSRNMTPILGVVHVHGTSDLLYRLIASDWYSGRSELAVELICAVTVCTVCQSTGKPAGSWPLLTGVLPIPSGISFFCMARTF